MKLMITTPTAVVLEEEVVRHVRAEDETGFFGILPRHADFLTALEISVLLWRDRTGQERYVALRGGVLRVSNGDLVEVATREAVTGDDFDALEKNVVQQFREEEERDAVSRSTLARLELAAIRRIREYIHPEEKGAHRAATSILAGNRSGTDASR